MKNYEFKINKEQIYNISEGLLLFLKLKFE